MSQDLETISTNIDLEQFYNQYKKIVRKIVIQYRPEDGTTRQTFGTGFVADEDGIIVTSAHIFPKSKSEIFVHRLDEEKPFNATCKYICRKWDVSLIEIDRDDKCDTFSGEYGVFPDHNSLSAGQTVLNIGNYALLAGSAAIGRVAFPCPDCIDPPCDPPEYCKEQMERCDASTKYRTMVDFWNSLSDPKKMTYEGMLHSELPVIQIHGFPCEVSRCESSDHHFVGSSSGGPVFNINGEVVGMVAMSVFKCVVAIHFVMLKTVIQEYKTCAKECKEIMEEI